MAKQPERHARFRVDQSLCTGDGLCVDHCPEAFVALEDGNSYVHYQDWVGNDPGKDESMLAPHPTNTR